MLEYVRQRDFANGAVYMLRTEDGYLLEVTDTYLPFYTKDCINKHTNELKQGVLESRANRWMIGVSCMSGCPVHCSFCATGKLKKWRSLTAEEIFEQVKYILDKNKEWNPINSQEFKINYTRVGEPFLNIDNVKKAMKLVDDYVKNKSIYTGNEYYKQC